MQKNLLVGGVALATVFGVALMLNNEERIKDYLHSNVFIIGHETMEVMVNCPFYSEKMCHVFRDECVNRIENGTQIDDAELVDCARVVEEGVQEVCAAMGGGCDEWK